MMLAPALHRSCRFRSFGAAPIPQCIFYVPAAGYWPRHTVDTRSASRKCTEKLPSRGLLRDRARHHAHAGPSVLYRTACRRSRTHVDTGFPLPGRGRRCSRQGSPLVTVVVALRWMEAVGRASRAPPFCERQFVSSNVSSVLFLNSRQNRLASSLSVLTHHAIHSACHRSTRPPRRPSFDLCERAQKGRSSNDRAVRSPQ
ncbi:hypothetical protein P280DRAFT_528178 [Massarina eburnea CBS 473.64]|uniref:Uncharacterized protein n=1 Tax=Massarina eburnea CBS 473.64 TaxID=1395130 RepID=A0A6A6RXY0_9PLEO|nr:hypothetical protein P280DRAFT_528178 [Massarina eburnea CBS 473.64]